MIWINVNTTKHPFKLYWTKHIRNNELTNDNVAQVTRNGNKITQQKLSHFNFFIRINTSYEHLVNLFIGNF